MCDLREQSAWPIQIQWLMNFYEEVVYPDAFKYSNPSHAKRLWGKKMLSLLAVSIFS